MLIAIATAGRARRPSAWLVDVALATALAAATIATGLAVQALTPLALDFAAWLATIAGGLFASLIARVQTLAGLLRRRRLAMLRARVLIDAVVEDGRDGILAIPWAHGAHPAGRPANPAAADLLGVARNALIDRPLAEAWPAGSAFAALPSATRLERSRDRAQAPGCRRHCARRDDARRWCAGSPTARCDSS